MKIRLTEGQLLHTVQETALSLRLLCYHTFDSQRSEAGYPDLTIVGPGGVLFRELKDDRRQPTAEQVVWLNALTAAGADAGLWRPEDLRSGRIVAELRALRTPRKEDA